MKNYPLPTGQNYWQPPAPLYYPQGGSTNLNLGGLGALNDVKAPQLLGAIGGGIMGAIMAGVINSVLPNKMKNFGNLLGIGLAPAMSIAGWFLFQESYDFDFTE